MSEPEVKTEERRHAKRSVFFLVPSERGAERLWVFKPEDEPDALAAVVLDVGDGGLRLLVEPRGPLAHGAYRLRILGAAGGEDHRFSLRLVWSESAGHVGYKAGFIFLEDAQGADAYVRANAAGEPNARIRCTLLPA